MQLTTLFKHWLIHQLINAQIIYVVNEKFVRKFGYDIVCAIEGSKMQ